MSRRVQALSGIELVKAALDGKVVDVPVEPDLRVESRSASLVVFGGRTREEVVLVVARHPLHADAEGRLRLSWHVGVEGVPTDGLGQVAGAVDRALDDLWDAAKPETILKDARDEWLSPYLDDLEGVGGDHVFEERSGGDLLVLVSWRGGEMAFADRHDLAERLWSMPDADLTVFLSDVVGFDVGLEDPASRLSAIVHETRVEREGLWKEDPFVALDEVVRRWRERDDPVVGVPVVVKVAVDRLGVAPDQLVSFLMEEEMPHDVVRSAATALDLTDERMFDLCADTGYTLPAVRRSVVHGMGAA